MGLLDGVLDDPSTAGLLGLSAGLLNAGGPSLMPHSFGQALAAGLGSMQQGRQVALDRQKEQLQMNMLQQQFIQAKRKNDLINNFLAGALGGAPASAPAGAPSGALPTGSQVSIDAAPTSAGTPSAIAPAGPAPSAGLGFGGVPSAAIAADLAFNNGGKIGEWVNDRSKPTDFAKQLVQSGIDPNSPLGRQIMQQQIAKLNYVAPVNARPGSIIRDPFDPSKVVAFNPHIPEGGLPQFDAGGNVTSIAPLPGAAAVAQGMSRAAAAGKASVKPITAYNGTQPVFTNELDASQGGFPTISPTEQNGRNQAQLEILREERRNATDPQDIAALDREIARVSKTTSPATAFGGGTRLTPGLAPGMAESQSALATTGAKRYNDLIQQASDSPTRVNVYDNILNLSKDGVATGPGQAWKNKVKGYIANTPGLSSVSSGWKDDVAGFQELSKFMYQNAQRNWQAAGGTGTDSQLEAFTKANPNDSMFPQALQKMAEWGKAGELALQGKANAMQSWKDANGGNVANQDQFERAWRNNFDPVLFQLKTMSPQDAAQYVANLKKSNPNGYAALMLKARAMQNMGGL